MTLSDFSYLKEQVMRTVVSSDDHRNHLCSVKELFRQDINSVRRFETINSIGQLLNTLELRGLLSEDNVKPLKDISRKVGSSELLSKIDEFEESHVPREYGNYYVSEKGNKNFLTESLNRTSPLESSMSKGKKDRIVKTVVEEIGSFWRSLARCLRIRECVIDDIDYNHQTLATKAVKMMEQFEDRCDPQKWFFVLCDALDTINRRDIVRSLQEIMKKKKLHENYYSLESIMSNSNKDRIVKNVIKGIGKSWRSLARSLMILECEIDHIDYNHHRLPTKAQKIMEQFEDCCDPQKCFFILCDALDTIHRKDKILVKSQES